MFPENASQFNPDNNKSVNLQILHFVSLVPRVRHIWALLARLLKQNSCYDNETQLSEWEVPWYQQRAAHTDL